MLLPTCLESAPREDRSASPCSKLHRLGDREGGREREALVDKFHTRGARPIDVAWRDSAVVDLDGAGVRPDEFGDDAREGRLSCAVLPDDGMNELGRKFHAHASQRRDVAIAN